jgi:hypothetical protein
MPGQAGGSGLRWIGKLQHELRQAGQPIPRRGRDSPPRARSPVSASTTWNHHSDPSNSTDRLRHLRRDPTRPPGRTRNRLLPSPIHRSPGNRPRPDRPRSMCGRSSRSSQLVWRWARHSPSVATARPDRAAAQARPPCRAGQAADCRLFRCMRNPGLNFVQDVLLVPFVCDRVYWIPHPPLEISPRFRVVRRKISIDDLIRSERIRLRFYGDQIRKRNLDAIVSQVFYLGICGPIQIKDADALLGSAVFCDHLELSRINCAAPENLCQYNPSRIRNGSALR